MGGVFPIPSHGEFMAPKISVHLQDQGLASAEWLNAGRFPEADLDSRTDPRLAQDRATGNWRIENPHVNKNTTKELRKLKMRLPWEFGASYIML